MVLFVPDCRSPDTQDFSRVTLFSLLRQIQPADHIPNVLYGWTVGRSGSGTSLRQDESVDSELYAAVRLHRRRDAIGLAQCRLRYVRNGLWVRRWL